MFRGGSLAHEHEHEHEHELTWHHTVPLGKPITGIPSQLLSATPIPSSLSFPHSTTHTQHAYSAHAYIHSHVQRHTKTHVHTKKGP